MKVLHTIAGLSSLSGGPSTCTRDLLDGINRINNILADLLTVADLVGENIGKGRRWLKEVACDYTTPLCFSKNITQALRQSDYDIYHTNGLWMHINHITCSISRAKGRPYILSPHGMLYPTALRIKSWKKKPMLWLWFNRDINKASCIHATCREELEYCRLFGYKGPIAVIPNPVVIPNNVTAKKNIPAERRIGFIGRLHPIKRIEVLIHAAAEAKKLGVPPFQVDIMGTGNEGYEKYLRNEAEAKGIGDIVNFLGFVGGSDKYERLSKLRALFVPSEQENFGMIIPEALICGTPVYASLGTPWEELNEYKCGWWKENSVESVTSIICDILSTPEDEILQMGINGRALIENKYKQSKVADMMANLYKWILDQGPKPEFVYTV